MKFQKLIYPALLTIALFIQSCDAVEEISWPTQDYPTMLNVEGCVTSDSIHHQLTLKSTADYFYNKPLPAVSGARVTVTSNNVVHLYLEDNENPGTYYSEEAFKGIPG
ncbi:MAG: hypothetical protein MI922_26510, partial [Bacteroidales bacterium]|nr:hypothetical protein [Bacteroidales bacterium]